MNVEEIRKKVRSLCEDAGLQFFFAVPNASEWAVTDCEHLRKIVSYHKELETLPLVTPVQRWIPVSERLPKERIAVLVYCPERKNIYCACYEEKQWWIFGAYFKKIEEDVDAWMPMPKSYKNRN